MSKYIFFKINNLNLLWHLRDYVLLGMYVCVCVCVCICVYVYVSNE